MGPICDHFGRRSGHGHSSYWAGRGMIKNNKESIFQGWRGRVFSALFSFFGRECYTVFSFLGFVL